MSTKHTPGSWAWETLGTKLMLVTPNRGKLIIMTATGRNTKFQFARRTDNLGGILYDATPASINTFPDARLIAAAPELLEACEAAKKYLSQCKNIEMFQGYDAEHPGRLIDLAIAKAEGTD